MYCVKCGAELADNLEKCPLCGTKVYFPERTEKCSGTFPKCEEKPQEMNHQGIVFVLTFVFLIPILLNLVCDLSINQKMVWSGYPVGALILGYFIIVFPNWFKYPNPVILVPVDFAGVILYLAYINFVLGENWFLPFALPVSLMLMFIVCAVITLLRYLKSGTLYILGGASIALGAASVITEILENAMISRDMLIWSYYPCVVFTVVGILLLLIAVCKPIRESFKRKFFI